MSSNQNPPVDDWEQAADQTDQNLSQQTSQLNISAGAPEFRPQASQFIPGQSFYPQYYPQQPMYSQQQYPPHGQGYGQQYGYNQQGGYGGGYGAQGGYTQYRGQQQYQNTPPVLQRGQNQPAPAAQLGILTMSMR